MHESGIFRYIENHKLRYCLFLVKENHQTEVYRTDGNHVTTESAIQSQDTNAIDFETAIAETGTKF